MCTYHKEKNWCAPQYGVSGRDVKVMERAGGRGGGDQ